MKAMFIAAMLAILASGQVREAGAVSAATPSEHNVLRERVLLVSDDGKSYPVALKCPLENNGTLEVLFKHLSGLTVRYRVELDGNTATAIQIDVAQKGKPLETDFSADLRSDRNPETLRVSNRVLKMLEPVLDQVCDGSQSQKDRFNRFLSDNARKVGQ